jgi:hypothetical protein
MRAATIFPLSSLCPIERIPVLRLLDVRAGDLQLLRRRQEIRVALASELESFVHRERLAGMR